MKITYLAHSCFLITTAAGTRILTDPYESGSYGGAVKYSPVKEPVDLVLISHDTHPDHSAVGSLPGSPTVVKKVGSTEVKEIKITGVATFHDSSGGRERGPNTVFTFEADGIKLCHLGDLGHLLSQAQVSAIGEPDIVMVPVGGYFTIDAAQATRVLDQLKPRVAIPMHFKTPKLDFPIDTRDKFLQGEKNVEVIGGSEVEISADDLKAGRRIVVLDAML